MSAISCSDRVCPNVAGIKSAKKSGTTNAFGDLIDWVRYSSALRPATRVSAVVPTPDRPGPTTLLAPVEWQPEQPCTPKSASPFAASPTSVTGAAVGAAVGAIVGTVVGAGADVAAGAAVGSNTGVGAGADVAVGAGADRAAGAAVGSNTGVGTISSSPPPQAARTIAPPMRRPVRPSSRVDFITKETPGAGATASTL